jgi:hypothetical protein|tara:strand:- start:611 stop:1360 length:750 start_codon:yes stop_codon:yes gene_type:complete
MNRKILSEKKQAILDELLKENPSDGDIILDLPSKNRFYQKIDAGEPITLSPLTWADEKALVDGNDGDSATTTLIKRCLKNINPDSLLDCDRSYILVKLREISIGPDYGVKITCPSCGKIGEVDVDTREFRKIEIPEDVTDPRKVNLPVSKVDVEVRFPRASEDQYTSDPTTMIENTWRFVNSVGEQTDKEIIYAFIEALTLRDSQTLRSEITGDYGVDTNFIYACSECDKETLLGVPIGPDFFLVNTSK